MQILFSVFKYVLKLQLETLKTEGSILGDLHSENITVMGGRSGGRVPGDEGLRFALVDCSGLLPVVGKHDIVTGKLLRGHLNCFETLLVHSKTQRWCHLWLCPTGVDEDAGHWDPIPH